MAGAADGVTLMIDISEEDYASLLDGAREAQLPPEQFLIRAIYEGAFIARKRRRVARILVQSPRGGLRELVG